MRVRSYAAGASTRTPGRGTCVIARSARVDPCGVGRAVPERAPLRLRAPPHRAHEGEALLADDVRALGKRATGATQRLVDVAEREPDDVREAPLDPLDERRPRALDLVRAGRVERLAGGDV